ncbi:neutral cholesterol ester hydrolase 1-like [Mytilus edulis]|uniref:neutral cholesterol ester hydrolase 1-like n=1 Tax=Mytilus edulis TaxID=6550 RepID=UPI0039F10BDA
MKTFLLFLTIFVVFASYRVYVVLNRPLPDNIKQPNVVRILDELGRIANNYLKLCLMLNINPASQPIKSIVNNGFGFVMNGVYSQNPDVQVTNTRIANVPVKIIQPTKLTRSLPAIIYVHGGGWTWFSTDTYSSYLENLSNRTKMIVIAIEYRKAPEYPFPAGYSDCIDVTWQILAGKSGVNVDTNKVVIAGDGSGGGIAAAVARHFPNKIMIQILINPVLQMLDFQTPSYQDNVDIIPGITSPEREALHWLLYIGQPIAFASKITENKHVFPTTVQSHFNLIDSAKHLPTYLKITNRTTIIPREHDFVVAMRLQTYITNETLSPMMHKNLQDIPKAYVITSQYDVLRDEAVMYTNRIHGDGNKVKLKHYKNAFHGFFLFSHESGIFHLDEAETALQELVDFLRYQVYGLSKPLREAYTV